MKRFLGLLLVCACTTGVILAADAAAPAPAHGTKVDPERATLAVADARRKTFSDAMRGLPAEKLAAFWTVYADYEKEKNEIAMARVQMVDKFGEHFATGLSDADIKEAVHELATLLQKTTDLRLKYFDILSQKIDVPTAGRFALTDDFITTSIRYAWLERIPFPGDEKGR